MANSPKSTPPTNNRACQMCARAKAKCIPQDDGSDQCSRCFRLKKDCVVLPRSARKKRSSNTNTSTAQLEEKIESLVTLLAAAQGTTIKSDTLPISPSQSSDQSIHSATSNSNPSPALWTIGVPAQSIGSWITPPQNHISINAPLPPSCSLLNRPTPQPSPSCAPLNDNTLQDEENSLRIFKEQFAPRFPFIVLPPHNSSSELSAQKPFLHRAIMIVASQQKRLQQTEMAKQICMDIAEALVLRGERSLDMLQAVIVYNTWSYYYSPTTPQSTAMIHLSFALLFDLGLNRPVKEVEGPESLVESSRSVGDINSKEAKRTLDERRAYLSCYTLTSVTSLYVRKTDGLSYSPYMDYNCKVLEDAAECESDLLLAALARLQFISEAFHRNVLSNIRDGADTKTSTPSWMLTKAARTELQSLWMSFPPDLRQNPTLIMNYHSVEAFLHEPCLQQNPISAGFSKGGTHRLDMLHSCLISVTSLLDLFLTQPLTAYYALPAIELSSIGQALVTVFKLSMVDEPGWDLAYVRKTAKTPEYFDRMISNFEQVGAIIDQSQPEPCRNSFPTGCAMAMGKIRAVYKARIAAENAQNTTQEQTNMMMQDGFAYGDAIDWMDDVYWQELLNEGNFFQ